MTNLLTPVAAALPPPMPASAPPARRTAAQGDAQTFADQLQRHVDAVPASDQPADAPAEAQPSDDAAEAALPGAKPDPRARLRKPAGLPPVQDLRPAPQSLPAQDADAGVDAQAVREPGSKPARGRTATATPDASDPGIANPQLPAALPASVPVAGGSPGAAVDDAVAATASSVLQPTAAPGGHGHPSQASQASHASQSSHGGHAAAATAPDSRQGASVPGVVAPATDAAGAAQPATDGADAQETRPALDAATGAPSPIPMPEPPLVRTAQAHAADAPPRAPVEAHVPAPVDSPQFPQALGTQLRLLVRDGVQEARLQLHPADMGPIRVEITLHGQAAHVEFHAAVTETRAALEAALPALAGSLREAGFTLAGGGVFQQPQDRPPSQPEAPTSSGRAQRPGDGTEVLGNDRTAPARATMRRVGLVDLYA